uniref:Uncharacterized protein n=1 Tax=Hyaloperonospora arabidopsidis (strain Emoy2) TaxID=559515 RepID=M4B2B4_HYAAE
MIVIILPLKSGDSWSEEASHVVCVNNSSEKFWQSIACAQETVEAFVQHDAREVGSWHLTIPHQIRG